MSGWGVTENGTSSDVLLYAWIKFSESRTNCSFHYANARRKPVNITDNMICAGGMYHDSCKGDSGGPLTCYKYGPTKKEFYLCGIVSFGIGCSQGVPGIYTDVSKYYDWIREKIRKNVKYCNYKLTSPSVLHCACDGDAGEESYSKPYCILTRLLINHLQETYSRRKRLRQQQPAHPPRMRIMKIMGTRECRTAIMVHTVVLSVSTG